MLGSNRRLKAIITGIAEAGQLGDCLVRAGKVVVQRLLAEDGLARARGDRSNPACVSDGVPITTASRSERARTTSASSEASQPSCAARPSAAVAIGSDDDDERRARVRRGVRRVDPADPSGSQHRDADHSASAATVGRASSTWTIVASNEVRAITSSGWRRYAPR